VGSVLRVGNAPTSWGVERAIDVSNPDWHCVLDEVASAGYTGIELGPLGFLPTSPEVLGAELSGRGLALSAGNVMMPLDDSASANDVFATATAVCDLLAALGASRFVIIDGMVGDREATAGRTEDAPRLDRARWRALVGMISALAEIAAARGLIATVHPHAGTHIEFRDEIERVLDETDPRFVRLCVDTGHALFAGIDPVELMEEHADRLAYVHLKDVDMERLGVVRREKLGFSEAYALGVFCVLGTGAVDFPGVHRVLERNAYEGWLTVEQDASPTGDSAPQRDATESLDYLRTVGLAS
jgi:inosose dehydratase